MLAIFNQNWNWNIKKIIICGPKKPAFFKYNFMNETLKFLYWRIDAMQKEIEKLNKKNKKLKKIIKEINNYKIIENENAI